MNICIYGSAVDDIKDIYKTETEKLGEALAKAGHNLVFGGGASGLMGAAARGFTKGNGRIIGIAPSFFDVDGQLYDKCDEFIKPDTMRERKQLLEDKSDAFIITPGGIGTFDEFFETIVLKSFHLQDKPMVIFNINGYYDNLKAMMDFSVKENFVTENNNQLYSMFNTIEELILYLEIRNRL